MQDEWWAPTEIETRKLLGRSDAVALNDLGIELWQATLGNRSANLARAIDCYKAALRVRTEANFPENWAGTQNNLGAAYSDLRSWRENRLTGQTAKCVT